MRLRFARRALVVVAALLVLPHVQATSAAASPVPAPAPTSAKQTGAWTRPPIRRPDAARKALLAAAAPSTTRSWQGTNPPSPCYYSVWNDPQGDAPELDVATYGALYDCPSGTWTFPVGTYDNWPPSELDFYLIAIDTDGNPATGCNGFEWELSAFWDPNASALEAGLFQTPDCQTATLVTTEPVGRSANNAISMSLPNSAIGNPTNIRWFGALKGINETQHDEFPDGSAVRQEDGFTGADCTVGPLGKAAPSSYAVVDDRAAAVAALEAEGQPGVQPAGPGKGVVRFAGDPVLGTAALARHGIRATATADHVRKFHAAPNDPRYGEQWSLPAVKASEAWDVTTGLASVVVADLDSGVDPTHPDLAGKLVAGYDATTGSALSTTTNSDSVGHGTAVAGVIGAATNNSVDVASLGYATSVMPVKIGNADVLASDEVTGLHWAADHGAKVINLSVGSDCADSNERTAVQQVQGQGVLVVASAGNSALAGDRPEYPAAYPDVLAVGATGFDGARAPYSNFGTYVDMVAPGGTGDGNPSHEILLLKPPNPSDATDRTTYAAGTSFAAPMVSAAAALVMAVNPALTSASVRSLLIDTTTDLAPPGPDVATGSGLLNAALAVQTAALRAKYNALAPQRVLDTRDGTGGPAAAIGQGETRLVTIDGAGGVPPTGVSAVALNVTATGGTASSFLTVFPSGASRPTASNLNFTAGETIPNLVVVRVGPDGKVNLFNFAGSVHVVFDVVGWYGATGDSYNAVDPHRILDTRDGTGDSGGAFGAGTQRSEQVTGVGGVPPSGVSAVVLNVTVTQPTASSFLTVFPSGDSRPTASNLNFTAGETIPNAVIARVGPDGKVSVYNLTGSVHVIFDVVGWFGSTGASFGPLPPHRVLDTRNGTGGAQGAFAGGTQRAELVTGVGGVPATGVSAVVLNVTVTEPTASSFLTLFPSGGTRPTASSLNFTAGQTIPNLVVVPVGADGKVAVYNLAGSVHVIFDVVGWYTT